MLSFPSEPIKRFATEHYWVGLAPFAAATALLFPMIFAPSLRTKIPHNGLILFLFTICKSTVLAFISVQNREDLGRISILANITIFLGLVLLNCQFKRQSTVLFEISFVSLLCLATFGSLLFFFEGPAESLIFCGFWILVFSLASVFFKFFSKP